jgi:hypothetical protein
MRGLILAFAGGLALAASAQAAPLARNPASIELSGRRPSSWCAMAVDAVGTGAAGATNGAIGAGANVSRTAVLTTPGAQVGTIPD